MDQPKHPRARAEGLILERMDGELLIYDLERHRAHCLSEAAALVFERCDGKSGAAQIAGRIQRELGTPVDPNLVRLALDEIARYHLLEDSRPRRPAGVSRRELIQKLGLAAATGLPLIRSIVAPEPVEAVTCKESGESCSGSAECCSGLCAAGTCA